MTPDTLRPSGHMTLTLYDAEGRVTLRVAQNNRVLDGGRLWLLGLLKGDSKISAHRLILGEEGFDPDAPEPLEQEAIIAVDLIGDVASRMDGTELIVTFKGNAKRTGVVIGGGIVIAGKRGDTETRDLYNFAKTPRPIEMAEGQSVSVNFRLAME